MTVGPRASTERKEEKQKGKWRCLSNTWNDRQEHRTFQNNRHDKRAHWVIPARTQEDKQKKKFSPRPHAHSHAFRHIRTLTHMTVSTHLHSSHTSWKKNQVHALRFKKKKNSMYNKFPPKKSERGTSEAESQGQWRQPLLQLPYCYYVLRVLYFANFCDSQKIAKLSTAKISTKQSGTLVYAGTCTITNCMMFSTLNMHNHSLLIVYAFPFLPSRAFTSLRKL